MNPTSAREWLQSYLLTSDRTTSTASSRSLSAEEPRGIAVPSHEPATTPRGCPFWSLVRYHGPVTWIATRCAFRLLPGLFQLGPKRLLSLRIDSSIGTTFVPSRHTERSKQRIVSFRVWPSAASGVANLAIVHSFGPQRTYRNHPQWHVAGSVNTSAPTGEPKHISAGDYLRHLTAHR